MSSSHYDACFILRQLKKDLNFMSKGTFHNMLTV